MGFIYNIARNIKKQGFLYWVKKNVNYFSEIFFRLGYKVRNVLISILSKDNAIHYGVWGYRNSGDTVLFKEVENCFLGTKFYRRDIQKGEIKPSEVQKINTRFKYLVLGGGGLFLKDQNVNSNSNWQFNISIDALNSINIPFVIFAIGYNRFRNQDEFDSIFTPHLISTIEKAVFVGIRNHGSISALKEYLPERLHHKLQFQPCPTTIINYLKRDTHNQFDISKAKNKTIAINMAFDRVEKRFGANYTSIINDIVKVARKYTLKGWSVVFVGHISEDKLIKEEIGEEFKFVDLSYKSAKKVIDFYKKTAITIGMRGHAQMIPFGLGKSIISLISHDKMRWFLDDINHPEWGVEILDNSFYEKLESLLDDIVQNYAQNQSDVLKAQEILFEITKTNMRYINSCIPD